MHSLSHQLQNKCQPSPFDLKKKICKNMCLCKSVIPIFLVIYSLISNDKLYYSTVKPRKFDQFFEILIQNKFETHWIQRIGPIHDLFNNCLVKHVFGLRRFFYTPKTYVSIRNPDNHF